MIFNFTHYDLDGAGCQIILNNIFPQVRKYQCGYGKLDKTINRIITDARKRPNCDLWITDLVVSPDHVNMLRPFFKNVFLIDHHPTTVENYANGLYENCQTKIDGDFSGALLTYKVFENELKKRYKPQRVAELEKLSVLIDDYDTWKRKYNLSYALNALFWHSGWDRFQIRFNEGFDGLDAEEEKIVKQEIQDKKDQIAGLEKFSVDDKYDDNVAFITTKDLSLVNDVTIFLSSYKYYFMYVSSTCSTSIRLRDVDINGAEVLERFVKDAGEQMFESYGGHPYAFSFILYPRYSELKNIVELMYGLYQYLKEEELKNG